MTRPCVTILSLALVLAVGGCGDDGGDVAKGGGAVVAAGPAVGAHPLSTPRTSIEHQLALLLARDVEGLKSCFTPRVRDLITLDVVEEALDDADTLDIEDLYLREVYGEKEGRRTATIWMSSGRTLTTVVETDGLWLADTLWFK